MEFFKVFEWLSVSFSSNMSSDLTRQCLTFEDRSSTPPHVRKFRRSTYLEPGKRYQHYGLVDDLPQLDLDNKIYGVVDEPTRDGAADLIHHPTKTELQRMNLQKSERTYKTVMREPLGHSPERNYQLPSKFTEGLATCFSVLHSFLSLSLCRDRKLRNQDQVI